jgi:hypothetical protein
MLVSASERGSEGRLGVGVPWELDGTNGRLAGCARLGAGMTADVNPSHASFSFWEIFLRWSIFL